MKSKPEKTPLKEKKKLALIFSGTITFLIFMVWLFVFVGQAKKELDRTAENRVAVYTTFQDAVGKLTDELVNQYKIISEKMGASSTLATSTFIGTTTEAVITTQTNLPAGDLNGQAITSVVSSTTNK